MKTFYSLLITILTTGLWAQRTIVAELNTSVKTIDGHFSPGEWPKPFSEELLLRDGSKTEVYIEYDSTGLFLAFVNNLGSKVRFPEVNLDIANNKANAFDQDDWWFHVSATDCEYQGMYGNYDSCQFVRPNWLAAPNFTRAQNPDTVEVYIPWTTLSYTLDESDTLGIGLVSTNTFSQWDLWPAQASEKDPSTWGNLVFRGGGLGLSNAPSVQVEVYPNPFQDQFRLNTWPMEWGFLQIYNADGRLIKELLPVPDEEISLRAAKGLYTLKASNGNWSKRILMN